MFSLITTFIPIFFFLHFFASFHCFPDWYKHRISPQKLEECRYEKGGEEANIVTFSHTSRFLRRYTNASLLQIRPLVGCSWNKWIQNQQKLHAVLWGLLVVEVADQLLSSAAWQHLYFWMRVLAKTNRLSKKTPLSDIWKKTWRCISRKGKKRFLGSLQQYKPWVHINRLSISV